MAMTVQRVASLVDTYRPQLDFIEAKLKELEKIKAENEKKFEMAFKMDSESNRMYIKYRDRGSDLNIREIKECFKDFDTYKDISSTTEDKFAKQCKENATANLYKALKSLANLIEDGEVSSTLYKEELHKYMDLQSDAQRYRANTKMIEDFIGVCQNNLDKLTDALIDVDDPTEYLQDYHNYRQYLDTDKGYFLKEDLVIPEENKTTSDLEKLQDDYEQLINTFKWYLQEAIDKEEQTKKRLKQEAIEKQDLFNLAKETLTSLRAIKVPARLRAEEYNEILNRLADINENIDSLDNNPKKMKANSPETIAMLRKLCSDKATACNKALRLLDLTKQKAVSDEENWISKYKSLLQECKEKLEGIREETKLSVITVALQTLQDELKTNYNTFITKEMSYKQDEFIELDKEFSRIILEVSDQINHNMDSVKDKIKEANKFRKIEQKLSNYLEKDPQNQKLLDNYNNNTFAYYDFIETIEGTTQAEECRAEAEQWEHKIDAMLGIKKYEDFVSKIESVDIDSYTEAYTEFACIEKEIMEAYPTPTEDAYRLKDLLKEKLALLKGRNSANRNSRELSQTYMQHPTVEQPVISYSEPAMPEFVSYADAEEAGWLEEAGYDNQEVVSTESMPDGYDDNMIYANEYNGYNEVYTSNSVLATELKRNNIYITEDGHVRFKLKKDEDYIFEKVSINSEGKFVSYGRNSRFVLRGKDIRKKIVKNLELGAEYPYYDLRSYAIYTGYTRKKKGTYFFKLQSVDGTIKKGSISFADIQKGAIAIPEVDAVNKDLQVSFTPNKDAMKVPLSELTEDAKGNKYFSEYGLVEYDGEEDGVHYCNDIYGQRLRMSETEIRHGILQRIPVFKEVYNVKGHLCLFAGFDENNEMMFYPLEDILNSEWKLIDVSYEDFRNGNIQELTEYQQKQLDVIIQKDKNLQEMNKLL